MRHNGNTVMRARSGTSIHVSYQLGSFKAVVYTSKALK